MTTPLWKKDDSVIGEAAMAFMAGRDIQLDAEILPFDIQASIAHVRGLQRIGCLTESQGGTLVDALARLGEAVASGAFVLDPAHEDGREHDELLVHDPAVPVISAHGNGGDGR